MNLDQINKLNFLNYLNFLIINQIFQSNNQNKKCGLSQKMLFQPHNKNLDYNSTKFIHNYLIYLISNQEKDQYQYKLVLQLYYIQLMKNIQNLLKVKMKMISKYIENSIPELINQLTYNYQNMNQQEELSLCIKFENHAASVLKKFFSQFKKACPKYKQVILRITQNEISLFIRDQIDQTFILNTRQLVEVMRLQTPTNESHLHLIFKDFDNVVQTLNQIHSNPKDLRLYLEEVRDIIYLTWSITSLDETLETKQSEVEYVENVEFTLSNPPALLIMPTWILNQMGQIAKSLECSLKLNFYLINNQYSVELIVVNDIPCPKYKSYLLVSNHKISDLTDMECFFEVNKYYISQFIDITSLEEDVVVAIQDSDTHPLILQYVKGEELDIGIVKQFIIPRMYQ